MQEPNNNPFKILEQDTKNVPPELRKKVMEDIATAKLIMELTNLFTGNFAAIIEGMLKTKSNSK